MIIIAIEVISTCDTVLQQCWLVAGELVFPRCQLPYVSESKRSLCQKIFKLHINPVLSKTQLFTLVMWGESRGCPGLHPEGE